MSMSRSRTSLVVLLAMASAGLALCSVTQVQAMQASAPDATDAASSIGPTTAQVAENARIREAIFNGEGGNPRFADYPVTKIHSGPAASLDLSDPRARMFRTRLSAALKDGEVGFAGEYTLVGWGCGTSCVSMTFVSKRTGKLATPSLGGELGPMVVKVDPHSALVVAEGGEFDDNYARTGNFAFFYVLEGRALKLIRKVPLPVALGEE